MVGWDNEPLAVVTQGTRASRWWLLGLKSRLQNSTTGTENAPHPPKESIVIIFHSEKATSYKFH